MDNTTFFTMIASVAIPMVPQVLSIILLRRVLRAEKTHHFALAASGMVQVLSGLWLMRACTKLPLFFGPVSDEAYLEWVRVTLDAGPYMAIALSLLVGWFWLVLAWSQRVPKASNRSGVPFLSNNLKDVVGPGEHIVETPSVFVKAKAKQRQDKRKR